jgi:hypothetical protein
VIWLSQVTRRHVDDLICGRQARKILVVADDRSVTYMHVLRPGRVDRATGGEHERDGE